MTKAKLILLFDGGCPLCQREVSFLRDRDNLNSISFVDIDSSTYKPELFLGISYEKAMGRMHAITDSGKILKDVQVFREAYRLVGLGWVYAPTVWPIIGAIVDQIYAIWAQWRLPLTFRPNLNRLCEQRNMNNNKTAKNKKTA